MNIRLILPAVAALFLAASPAFAEGGMHEQMGNTGMAKEHPACPEQLKGVKTGKKAVEKGIEITLTAESPEAVAELREKASAHYASKDCPLVKVGDDVKVENTGNGVKVTVTAKKRAAVKKLQSAVKKGHSCGAGEHKKSAAAKDPEKAVKYVCPMGDYEGSDKPGKCPTCGMNLVEKK